MDLEIKKEGEFTYFESDGPGVPIVLLHGLMGALSNFEELIKYFEGKNKIVLPILPFFEIPLRKLSVSALVEHIAKFVEYKGYEKVYVLGNSLGGHIAQMYTLQFPGKVQGMILTGSSGLFESAMGSTFPKRGDYEYIKKKTQDVFYNPDVASKELIDNVYAIVNDLRKAMCVVALAKSAIRHNLEDQLHKITANTLIIWGIQDHVTPLWVGEKFHECLINSELIKINFTGHAPMMERPKDFNDVVEDFIKRVEDGTFLTAKKGSITID
ncbi:MAG: alpha/beta hydrolase [Saprospiraceae bacterium]|nr:alpha/beta hydrolase [Saprospiraceae bacterium]MBK6564580.1 alpha/beta hydrolase [Saprospiraceae bacterium]MBK8079317.1 alpha/beta hydrolase [Saprospiraceae bacterium]MBK8371789.1 alpha/beta hydrolase [Saprospiraceae bacterium]MBK8547053.1 alpha/beta hydrolase [Saprospiraceae bacterium]